VSRLRQYELVRLLKLRSAPEQYDGWKVNRRSPKLGDVGTLVEILHAPGFADRYIVECVSATGDGTTDWATSPEDELEPAG
jgi:hypothetical protein